MEAGGGVVFRLATDWGMMISTCEGRRRENKYTGYTQNTCIRNTPTLKRATLGGIVTTVFTKHTNICIFFYTRD
jgi:hypothetical protein